MEAETISMKTPEATPFDIDKSSPLPLYMQVKRQIHDYIQARGLKQGQMLPPVGELSEMAKVSLKTADRALNELITEGVCYRQPKRGTFVGSAAKQVGKRRVVGVYHAFQSTSLEQSDRLQYNLFCGIQEEARKTGLDLFFISGEPESLISRYLKSAEFELGGILMMLWFKLDEGMRLARKFPHVRFVYLNYFLDGFEEMPDNVYGVFNDEFAGSYQMTDHLLARGHKRIAVAAVNLVDENYRMRIAGYRQAVSDAGMPLEDDLIWLEDPGDGQHHREIGAQFARRWMSLESPPSALFCQNDLIAAGAIETLREAGRGGDCEVVGFDNILPEYSLNYGFSTVNIDFPRMGRRAINVVANRRTDYPRVMKIAPQLLLRSR